MSLPLGLNADTVNPAGCLALIRRRADLDFYKARIPALGNKSADLVRAHIHNRRKFDGCVFPIFYDSRLGENDLNLIACRQHPASTVENLAAMRSFRYQFLLLFDADAVIIVTLEMLQIKAPPRK